MAFVESYKKVLSPKLHQYVVPDPKELLTAEKPKIEHPVVLFG